MAYLPLPKGNEIVCLLEFMKIIYAIVSSDDGNRVTEVLNENQYMVTKLATTGGFLKKGNCTLMIGTEAEKVDHAIELIKETCGKRQKITCNVPAPNIRHYLQDI